MNKRDSFLIIAVAVTAIFALSSTTTRMTAAKSGESSVGNQSQTQQSTTPAKPVPTAATRWEYRILRSHSHLDLQNDANELANQGFDVIAFELLQPFAGDAHRTDSHRYTMVLKRAKP